MVTSPADGGVFRLLFVCTGNTCRSPMAEVIARRRLDEFGWEQVEVRSAGVAAYSGSPASEGAVHAADAQGLDLSSHRSTPLTHDLATGADLILSMSPSHLMRVIDLGAGDRAALLTSYAGGLENGSGVAIPDPVGGSDEEYLETYRILDDLIGRVLERLHPVIAP